MNKNLLEALAGKNVAKTESSLLKSIGDLKILPSPSLNARPLLEAVDRAKKKPRYYIKKYYIKQFFTLFMFLGTMYSLYVIFF